MGLLRRYRINFVLLCQPIAVCVCGGGDIKFSMEHVIPGGNVHRTLQVLLCQLGL